MWDSRPRLSKAQTAEGGCPTSGRFVPSVASPGCARPVDAEPDQATLFHLGDVHRAAVGPAEAEIRRRLPEDVDLLQHLALGRQLHHGPLAVPGDVEVAVD